jgi:hypothetical protein
MIRTCFVNTGGKLEKRAGLSQGRISPFTLSQEKTYASLLLHRSMERIWAAYLKWTSIISSLPLHRRYLPGSIHPGVIQDFWDVKVSQFLASPLLVWFSP